MKILHLCLSNFYIDGYGYQENILPILNQEQGHTVKIIASTITYINGQLGYTKPSQYNTETGIPIVRLPYVKWVPSFIAKKIGIYSNVYKEIVEFSPDIIFYHGTGGYGLKWVAKYKKKYPKIKLYADNHAFSSNTALNWYSKLVYKAILNPILRKNVQYFDKIFYISEACKDFLIEFKGISSDILEFMPLGGIILDDQEYYHKGKIYRDKLQLREDNILLVHSGKLNKDKRTDVLLEAFTKVKNDKMVLAIIGVLTREMEELLSKYQTKDKRIIYLGWKSQEDLRGFLCACDLYMQPGSESATMQNALCCRCPVALFPSKSHHTYIRDNGFFISNSTDIENCLTYVTENPSVLKKMSLASYKLALDILDYRKMASRICE